jgi:hypothetical protein
MGDIDFKGISTTENSNKFHGMKNLVENVVTFEGLQFNSSMIPFYIWLFKTLFIC